jgi:hypothetical protein
VRVGTALFLIASGLILTYAVQLTVPGIDLGVVGVVLFFVGLLGLVLAVGSVVLAERSRRPPAPRRRDEDPTRVMRDDRWRR